MAKRDYESTSITVHWDAEVCIHSGHCAATLPRVFDPERRPWIDVSADDDEDIVRAIDGCPSGALSYSRRERTDDATPPDEAPPGVTVRVEADGPYEVTGPVRIVDSDGNLIREARKVALCRCGHSDSKPFCDGSHERCGFRDPGVFRRRDRSP